VERVSGGNTTSARSLLLCAVQGATASASAIPSAAPSPPPIRSIHPLALLGSSSSSSESLEGGAAETGAAGAPPKLKYVVDRGIPKSESPPSIVSLLLLLRLKLD
jgi:hypothetical protein